MGDAMMLTGLVVASTEPEKAQQNAQVTLNPAMLADFS